MSGYLRFQIFTRRFWYSFERRPVDGNQISPLEGTSRVNNRFHALNLSSPEVAPWSGPVYFATFKQHHTTWLNMPFTLWSKASIWDAFAQPSLNEFPTFADNFSPFLLNTLLWPNLITRIYSRGSKTRHVLLQSEAPPNWINIIFPGTKTDCVFSIIPAFSHVPHYYAFCNAANPR